ncbi:hypothetical protein B0H14DRAFT_2653882 [Mycena olivaceomarginata]|nr:hypothetical protein B0H14DRAFT_2653882 [Mycena olivaceomarginata]
MSGHGESTAAQDNNESDARPKRKGVPKPAAKHKAPAKPRGEVSDRAAILDRQVAVLPDRSGSSSMNFLSSSDFLIPPPWTSNILNASFVSYGHSTEGWRGKLRGKQSRHLVSDARQALYETLMQDSSDARQGLLLAMQRSNARKSAQKLDESRPNVSSGVVYSAPSILGDQAAADRGLLPAVKTQLQIQFREPATWVQTGKLMSQGWIAPKRRTSLADSEESQENDDYEEFDSQAAMKSDQSRKVATHEEPNQLRLAVQDTSSTDNLPDSGILALFIQEGLGQSLDVFRHSCKPKHKIHQAGACTDSTQQGKVWNDTDPNLKVQNSNARDGGEPLGLEHSHRVGAATLRDHESEITVKAVGFLKTDDVEGKVGNVANQRPKDSKPIRRRSGPSEVRPTEDPDRLDPLHARKHESGIWNVNRESDMHPTSVALISKEPPFE